jgi:hypothetical protein
MSSAENIWKTESQFFTSSLGYVLSIVLPGFFVDSKELFFLAYPDYDGGSPVIEFEVQVINPDNSSRIVYHGRDLDCVVAGLLPGRPYLFQVRAFNRAGV